MNKYFIMIGDVAISVESIHSIEKVGHKAKICYGPKSSLITQKSYHQVMQALDLSEVRFVPVGREREAK